MALCGYQLLSCNERDSDFALTQRLVKTTSCLLLDPRSSWQKQNEGSRTEIIQRVSYQITTYREPMATYKVLDYATISCVQRI